MDETPQKETLVLLGAKVKQNVKETIELIADNEDRSVSYTVARLLESHPEVQKKLTTSSPVAA